MKVRFLTQRAARVAAVLAFALALCVGLIGAGEASAGPSSGIPTANSLQSKGKVEASVLRETEGGKIAQFIVLLAEQADLSAAYAMKDQDARGWYVYNTLRAHAEKSQAGIRAALTRAGAPFRSFWVANALLVTGDRSIVESLAARPDVAHIESNRQFKGIDHPADSAVAAPSVVEVVEWGVQRVNAPQVWALGYTGQGMVIGNQDTGVRWSHNALRPKYRGWDGATANHNYNWWDAIHSGGGSCGPNTQIPCDDNGHGTHTTGTTAGDDGTGNQVGVAPGSKWIGCRNMNQGVGTPATYTECFQFFIAPTDLTGQNPNPSLRPHVMNNSWGCPPSEGCAANTLQAIVESSQAAGIFVEVSAGNAGSSCSSVNDPPAIYEASFSTGATDISNNLAGFSSRGPVTLDGSGRLKPNISAPGVNVRSSTRGSDTSYGSLSGTSMAGPHVVGVIALLWSSNPDLVRQIDLTKQVLQNTANPQVNVSPAQTCGGIPHTQIPNNSFGYGRVDALAAVNYPVGTATPTFTGTPPTNTPTRTRTLTPTPTPTACNNYVYALGSCSIVPGTTNTGNACDDCSTSITLPFPFALYGGSYTSANVVSNGSIQFVTANTAFTNSCLPQHTSHGPAIFPHWDDLRTDGTACTGGCGIFTSISGSAPNRIFNIEWRTTYFSGGGEAYFEVRLYEGPSGAFDIVLGTLAQGGSSATIGVQDGAGRFTSYSCNSPVTNNLCIHFTLPGCGTSTPTPTGSPPTSTPAITNTPTVTRTSCPTSSPTGSRTPFPTTTRTHTPIITPTMTPTPPGCVSYSVTIQKGAVVPGTTDIGLHCDDCIMVLPLPFPFRLYGVTYNQGFVSSNGNMQFGSNYPFVPNGCPPNPPFPVSLILYPDDLRTDCTGCGVYTVLTGSAPNRRFHIEWRAQIFPVNTPVNFEIIMYENSPNQQVDYVYNQTPIQAGQAGIVRNQTDYTCYPNAVGPTFRLIWTYQGCPTVTPTPTGGVGTVTNTPTNTNTQVGTPASTHTHTRTPVPTATYCAIIFTDVLPSDFFYEAVRYLYCMGAISGYADNTFRPYNNTTRGQITKIVTIGFGIPINTEGGPHFIDVPVDHPFYPWIETLYNEGIISGYTCGPGCLEFRPYNNVTRGQLVKVVCNAAGWTPIVPSVPTFSDVPTTHTFYAWIETAYCHGVISGYSDGTFRPGNSATRGQIARIVHQAILGHTPFCGTPTPVR